MRDIAPRFENRLFLSATPHNGHSNSFSALLELLDPQRFTRGVKVRGRAQLEPVMVRRLKEDLRKIGVEQFPVRRLVQVELTHDGATWSANTTGDGDPASTTSLDANAPIDLDLAKSLAEYTRLMKPERGTGGLVFINLQKRLLSSVEAFYRTLQAHAHSVTEGRARTAVHLPVVGQDDDEYGVDDEALDEADENRVSAASQALASPIADRAASASGPSMMALAAQHRGTPDAKVSALFDWIRRNQCPAVRAGGPAPKASKSDRWWSDRRVIVFTEYRDTKRYLLQILQTAVEGTPAGRRADHGVSWRDVRRAT